MTQFNVGDKVVITNGNGLSGFKGLLCEVQDKKDAPWKGEPDDLWIKPLTDRPDMRKDSLDVRHPFFWKSYSLTAYEPDVIAAFEKALADLRDAGYTVEVKATKTVTKTLNF